MEIKDFFSIYQNAAWSKDAKSMINLYDENVVIFDMWDKGFISNHLEWNNIIEGWLGNLGEENVKVQFEMVQIFQSENVGFATGLIVFQAISKEGLVLRAMKNRITLGFLKYNPEYALDFIRKEIRQNSSEARKFSSTDAALAA